MNTNSRNVTYSTVGDYQLPNLTLNQPRKPLGKYGRLRRTYLMNHRPVLYNTMLLNGSLYPHLMEVEQTAESQMQQTMKQLLKQNPAPDKEQNQMAWVQHMNSLRAQSEELVLIGMVERGLKEPGLATIVKLLNALNISADTLLCDLVPSASHVTDDEIRKRLEHLTPVQKKAALDLLDTYIGNLPYLTNEE